MKKYIIWDSKDGLPQTDDNGLIISSGLIGSVEENNVYLTTYADYEGAPRHTDLKVGDWTEATFRLSGSKGTYRIYRVQ